MKWFRPYSACQREGCETLISGSTIALLPLLGDNPKAELAKVASINTDTKTRDAPPQAMRTMLRPVMLPTPMGHGASAMSARGLQ